MRKEVSCYFSTRRQALVLRLGCISVVVATESVPSFALHIRLDRFGLFVAVFGFATSMLQLFFHSTFHFFFCFLSSTFAALGLLLRAPSLPDGSAAEILCSWSAGQSFPACRCEEPIVASKGICNMIQNSV
jgi:hypothetical protein